MRIMQVPGQVVIVVISNGYVTVRHFWIADLHEAVFKNASDGQRAERRAA